MNVAIPQDSVEREFLTFWAEKLLDPRDPQNERWLALEMQQIARGRELAEGLARLRDLSGARVLDIGCQTGGLALALAQAGAEVTAVDVAPTLLEAAAMRARCHGVSTIHFEMSRAEVLPFERGRFDLVTLVDVIEHVECAPAVLAEAVRVLAPGGLLWLQGPNRFSPRWFLRDPHYQMAGISVLPPGVGRWYVTQVRGRPRYDVGVFPVGSLVVRRLEKLGMIVELPVGPGGVLSRVRHALAMRLGAMFIVRARKPLASAE